MNFKEGLHPKQKLKLPLCKYNNKKTFANICCIVSKKSTAILGKRFNSRENT
jgi:hypothetical protein